MQVRRIAALFAFSSLAACAGDGAGLDENGRPIDTAPAPLVPELASIQANVFTPTCAPCHAGAAAPLGLRLDEGASYAMLVDEPSVEDPSLRRVEPGDPDSSYLIHKIEGTASAGGRMPLNAPALSLETIAVIRQWIANGAPLGLAPEVLRDDQPGTLESVWPIPGTALREPPRAIQLAASTQIDTTLLDAGVLTLRRSGGDGDFTNDNEQIIPVSIDVRSLNPSVVSISAPADAWPADEYELRVSGSAPLALADLNARPIDGDGDGAPGGDFVLRFSIEETR